MSALVNLYRKIKVTNGYLAENPRWLCVCMDYEGRTLLGKVRDWYRDADGIKLDVRHFNGEPWPLQPLVDAVEVI